MEMAPRGVGLGFVSELDVREQLAAGTVQVVVEEFAFSAPGLFLFYPSRHGASPPLRALVDHLRRHPRRG